MAARWGLRAASALACVGLAAQSAGAADVADLETRLDVTWILTAAALVFLMQIGFLLLEAGMVRSKNSINVAQKNVLDFTVAVLMFAAAGFMLAFGASSRMPFGFDAGLFMLRGADQWTLAFFVFQVMFCGTAATIVAGAVAERMRLSAYVICSIFLAGLIYPVFVHWAWGAGLGPNTGAFLGNRGFVDFAGSTVVHATGGWVSLAACMVLGPRLGRYDANGQPVRMAGHNPVLAAAGALLLFVGWIGFNGGSTLAANLDTAHIIANTVLAGAAGTLAGYLLGRRGGAVLPEKALEGMIGGLVGVTAGCLVLDALGSVLVGLLGGAVAVWGNCVLQRRFKIDDAVGAIGVHAFAGVAGTLALAFLAPIENLPLASRLDQLGIQALGSGLNFCWAFGLGLGFFMLLDRLMSLRVSADAEEVGLNQAEHATRLGIGHVEDAFGALVKGDADLSMRLPVEPGDDAERLTLVFNALMDNLQTEETARGAAADVRRSAEEADRLSALANATFEALVITVDGVIVDGNAPFARLVGAPLERLKGRRLVDLVLAADRASLEAVAPGEEAAPREIRIMGAHGEQTPVEARARNITYRGVDTQVLAMVDLRERKNAEAQIRHLAQHDPLTNLPNRAVFNERLEEVIAQSERTGVQFAVVLVDLDRFKDINDLHGHAAGDDVLKETATRLRTTARPGDMVARLGGDEFAVLQFNVAFPNQTADFAHRLVQELAKPIQTMGGALTVRSGASVGAALCPRDGHDAVQLMNHADTALYHAKNSGRNGYALFEEGMDAELKRRRVIEADLLEAIEHSQFELRFQPRLAVADMRVRSYEALIRWRHPEKGVISPDDFIPVAEQSGAIIAIGDWALKEACRLAVAQLGSASVSVNVSPMQFREPRLVETVRAALEESGLPPRRLEIEITESLLIDDDERAIAMLTALKKIGVHIALDDFGTGYSSLGYLSRFAFDTIKIDRSFVQRMGTDEDTLAIIETIIGLGRGLEIDVVAEGVEQLSELRLLAEMGCDEIQGFLVGRPETFDRIVTEPPTEVRDVLAAVKPAAAAKALRGVAAEMRRAPSQGRRSA